MNTEAGIDHPQEYKISKTLLSDEQKLSDEFYGFIDRAEKGFNGFLVAYELATRESYAPTFGSVDHFRMVGFRDLLDVIHTTGTTKIFSSREYHLTDNDVLLLIEQSPAPSAKTNRIHPLHDVEPRFVSLINAAYRKTESEILYRFEFEAKAAYWGDPIHRLLMACVALEAAHASLLRRRIKKRNPTMNAESAIKDFLAKAGTTKTIELTPLFVMEKAEQPPADVIKKALRGITARNAIMHSGRHKGRYSLQGYTWEQLNGWANGILELLQYFKKAIEADIASEALAPANGDVL